MMTAIALAAPGAFKAWAWRIPFLASLVLVGNLRIHHRVRDPDLDRRRPAAGPEQGRPGRGADAELGRQTGRGPGQLPRRVAAAAAYRGEEFGQTPLVMGGDGVDALG